MDADLDFEDLPPPPPPPPASGLLQPFAGAGGTSASSHAPPSPSSSSSLSLSPDREPWPLGRDREPFTFGRKSPSASHRDSPPLVASTAMLRSVSPMGGPNGGHGGRDGGISFPRSPGSFSMSAASRSVPVPSSPRLPGSPNATGHNRHRRKSSVSISPPFSRSPSPTARAIGPISSVSLPPASYEPAGASGANGTGGPASPVRSPFLLSASPFPAGITVAAPTPRSPNGHVSDWHGFSHPPRAPSPLPLHVSIAPLSPVDEDEALEAAEGSVSAMPCFEKAFSASGAPALLNSQGRSGPARPLPASVITPATASVSLHTDVVEGTSSRPFGGTARGAEPFHHQRAGSVPSAAPGPMLGRRARAGSRSGLDDFMAGPAGGLGARRRSLDSAMGNGNGNGSTNSRGLNSSIGSGPSSGGGGAASSADLQSPTIGLGVGVLKRSKSQSTSLSPHPPHLSPSALPAPESHPLAFAPQPDPNSPVANGDGSHHQHPHHHLSHRQHQQPHHPPAHAPSRSEIFRGSSSSAPNPPSAGPSSPSKLKSPRFMASSCAKKPPPLDLSFARERGPSSLRRDNDDEVPTQTAGSPPRSERTPVPASPAQHPATPPTPPPTEVHDRSDATPPALHPDLALPPRSGWDCSDDVDDSPPTPDMGPDAVVAPCGGSGGDWTQRVGGWPVSPAPTAGGAAAAVKEAEARARRGDEGQSPEDEEKRAAEWRAAMANESEEARRWGAGPTFDTLGVGNGAGTAAAAAGSNVMDLDLSGLKFAAAGMERGAIAGMKVLEDRSGEGGAARGCDGDVHMRDEGFGEVRQEGQDDGLSTLERIFLFAKSEYQYHRVAVSQRLAEWLEDVDICEAVEYILPLLNGLATDEEAVREAFAPVICNVMWYFFTNCPLLDAEDEAATPQASIDALRSSSPSATGSGDATIRGDDFERSDSPEDPVGPRHRSDSGPGSAASSTSSTTRQSEEDSQTSATSCHPSSSGLNSPTFDVAARPRIPPSCFTSVLGSLLADQHESVAAYARYAFLTFLCRLTGRGQPDDSDLPADAATNGVMGQLAMISNGNSGDSGEAASHKHHPYTFTEEAKRVIENEMIDGIVLALANLDADPGGVESEDPQRTVRQEHPFLDAPEREHEEWANVPLGKPVPSMFAGNFFNDLDESVRSTFSDTASDFGPFPTSRDSQAEEAAMGRQISMTLIAAISQSGCLAVSTLAEKLLPEVAKMPQESMQHVRQQASLTLAALSAVLPGDVVAAKSLPLYRQFAGDAACHVRRQACLGLPSIVKGLTPDLRASIATEAVREFADDENRDVRGATSQILGQLIYAFNEDEGGVPSEILDLFLHGFPKDREEERDGGLNHGHRIVCGLYSSPALFQSLSTQIEAERQMARAYNFPAVVLTLGPARWPEVREVYCSMALDGAAVPAEARHSLACALHEVAKIIGPDQASANLPQVLTKLLKDVPDIVAAVLANLDAFFACLRDDVAVGLLKELEQAWEGATASVSHWRIRERTVLAMPALAARLGALDTEHCFVALLMRALRDPVSAVREAGIAFVPALLEHATPTEADKAKLSAFLSGLAHDSDFRLRMVFPAALRPLVQAHIFRDTFEARLLPEVCRLADDKVAGVRIGVARLIGELCASSDFYADASQQPQSVGTVVANLGKDAESVVRSFVAHLQPPPEPHPSERDSTNSSVPSSPVAIQLAQEEDAMDEDDLTSSGVQVFGSAGSADGMAMEEVAVVSLSPPKGGNSASSSWSSTGRHRSPSPTSPIDMDLETVDLSSAAEYLGGKHGSNGGVGSPSNEARTFSRPPLERRASSPGWRFGAAKSRRNSATPSRNHSFHGAEDFWMRETEGGFVEVCDF